MSRGYRASAVFIIIYSPDRAEPSSLSELVVEQTPVPSLNHSRLEHAYQPRLVARARCSAPMSFRAMSESPVG